MNEKEVTTWYLAMSAPEQLKIKKLPNEQLMIRECVEKQFEYNRFLYAFVGQEWEWTNKLSWSDQQWRDYAEADNLRTWVIYDQGSPAGYFELQKNDDTVELAYFGLARRFIDRGLGGGFLSQAIQQAWNWGAERVQVNTCSLDHPSALANYQARGFSIYKTETKNG